MGPAIDLRQRIAPIGREGIEAQLPILGDRPRQSPLAALGRTGDRHGQITQLIARGTVPKNMQAIPNLGFLQFAKIAIQSGDQIFNG